MVYVVSDLHGILPGEFERLLENAEFSNDDICYVLGDVIDRGEYGIELLKWLMAHDNFKLIRGNHEDMMLECEDVLYKLINNDGLSRGEIDRFNNWYYNGAEPTLSGLVKESDVSRKAIFDYIRSAPLYESITVGKKRFILSHSGLGNFRKKKKLSDYTKEELVWNRPEFDEEYYDDAMLVFGHTPTLYYGKEYAGRAIVTRTYMDIDGGVACGMNPIMIRLDDMKEFYI